MTEKRAAAGPFLFESFFLRVKIKTSIVYRQAAEISGGTGKIIIKKMKKNFAIMMTVGAFIYGFFCPFLNRAHAATISCDTLSGYNGSAKDASSVIQGCISRAAANDIVELPAGEYYVLHRVNINAKPITLRTKGKDASMPRCQTDDCAELIAMPAFDGNPGILYINQKGTIIDHLIINGNKSARADSASASKCKSHNTGWGYNIWAHASNFQFTNSVSKNALCGTGMEMGGAGVTNNRVVNSLFSSNGVHNVSMMWADGLTVHDCSSCVFENNEFVNGTDIDFILGGCQNCMIKNNKIRHTGAWSGAAFVGLMLHAWTSTSGNYTGTTTTQNTIDCGPKKRCGYGLYLGAHSWYKTMSYGGSVYNNKITNSQQGFVIDDFKNVEVYNNPVSSVSGYSYTIGNDSLNVDFSKETSGAQFKKVSFDGRIPNMSCKKDCASANGASFVNQSVPETMVSGQNYSVSIVMRNAGDYDWTADDAYRLGSQSPRDNIVWDKGRVGLSANETIVYGGSKTFKFNVTAPATPGTYDFQWQMVQDGVEWFGDKTEKLSVIVTPYSSCTDGCAAAGKKQCSGTAGYQTCGNYDNDSCLEWSAKTDCPAGQSCSGEGVCAAASVTVSGKVAKSTGEAIPNAKIFLCGSNGNVTADSKGKWSKTLSAGASYCARVVSGLPAGYTAVQGTGNNSCHTNSSTYEYQVAGKKSFTACSASGAGSWDRSNDSGVDFSVTYSSCTDGCAAAGKKQCSGTAGYQTCGNYDNDSCLEWSAKTDCPAGQSCSGEGVCAAACNPKTCAALGNYQCGSWDDGCGGTVSCGSCASGKECSKGKCVSNCASRANKKCDNGNLYWYDSCGKKEELAQDCGANKTTSKYQCNGNWTQKEIIRNGCSNNACTSESVWQNDVNCAFSGKICKNGRCVNDIEIDKKRQDLERDKILAEIEEIRQTLTQLMNQLITELRRQM